MSFRFVRFLKGLLISEENTLTPKEIEIQPGGTSGTKTSVISSQTVNRTITLPDATDTLVGKATNDVLTNKTIDADNNTISNISNTNIKNNANIDFAKMEVLTANKILTSDAFGVVSTTSVGETDLATQTDLNNHITDTSTHGVSGDIVGTTDSQTLTNKTIDADDNTISNIDNAAIKSNAEIDATKIADGTVDNTEFQYLDGVTSPIQTQLNDISDLATDYIGATSVLDDSPDYSSDVRGVANENLTARLGTLTDAIGDSQEDRSAYLRSDTTVTWTGTELQFASDIILEIINTKNATIKTATILAANSPIVLANEESAWISIDRTLATQNVTINKSGTTPIPAQTQSNKDVFVIARRKDALGFTYLHIPLHKQIIEPGQTFRLGATGSSGGGSGSTSSVDLGANTIINAGTANAFYNMITGNKNYSIINLSDGETIQVSITASGGNYTISFVVNGGLPLAFENSILDLVVENQTIQYYWFTLINGIVHIVTFTNLINQQIPLGVTYNTPSQSYQKTAYSLTVSSTGTGGLPTNYTIQSGSLPPNMTINSTTGQISGTPASGSSIGNFAFTVRASNLYGYQDIPLTINVDVPNEWPLGSGGDLTVLNGQTVNLTTGVYDYANVTIEQGGTLTVGSHVIIGCRYDFKCSGVVNGNGSNSGGTFNLVHPIYGSTSYIPAAYNAAGSGGAGGQANGRVGGTGGTASNGFGGGGGGGASANYTRTNGASGGVGGTNAGSGNSGGTPTNISWDTIFTVGAVGGTNNAAINGANASAQNGGAGSLAVALSRSGGGGGAAGWEGAMGGGKEVRLAGAGGGGGGGGNRGNHGSRVEVYTHRSITQNGVQPVGNIFSNGTSGTVSGAGGTGGTYSNGIDPNYGGGGGGSGGGGSGGNGGQIVLRYRVAQTIGTSITAGSAGSFAAAGPGGTGTAGNGSPGSTGTAGSNGTIGTTTTQLLT